MLNFFQVGINATLSVFGIIPTIINLSFYQADAVANMSFFFMLWGELAVIMPINTAFVAITLCTLYDDSLSSPAT